MRLASCLLLVKYAVKSALLARMPLTYYRIRGRLGLPIERELRLVACFADPLRPAFDIGTHFGVWSAAMVPHFSAVHAFEAMPRLAAILRRGHRGGRVIVHEVAVSNRAGRTTLRTPVAGWGRSTVEPLNRLSGLRDEDGAVREFEVPTARLDDMNLPDPAFIKIDVEGHELAVLEGARSLLARARPVLVVEMEDRHAPETRAPILALLSDLGYKCVRLPGSENRLFLPGA
jgi:FkbM family methyltransferase